MSSFEHVCGLLGKHEQRKQIMQAWNHFFITEKLSAGLHQYPTNNDTIQLRLSEMFTLNRLFYIVNQPLGIAALPLLDTYESDEPNYIINYNGVLHGAFSTHITNPQAFLAEQTYLQTTLTGNAIL